MTSDLGGISELHRRSIAEGRARRRWDRTRVWGFTPAALYVAPPVDFVLQTHQIQPNCGGADEAAQNRRRYESDWIRRSRMKPKTA